MLTDQQKREGNFQQNKGKSSNHCRVFFSNHHPLNPPEGVGVMFFETSWNMFELPGLAALPQVRPQSGREAAEWIQSEMPRADGRRVQGIWTWKDYRDMRWYDMIYMIWYDYSVTWHDDFLVKIFDALRLYGMLSPFNSGNWKVWKERGAFAIM